jgi:excisionase family DNA binding protein
MKMGKPVAESRKIDAEPLTVTVTQARQLTGLGPTKLYAMLNDGTLKSSTLGGRRLIHYRELKKLLGLADEVAA